MTNLENIDIFELLVIILLLIANKYENTFDFRFTLRISSKYQ